jgi:energy-coupling factor transport system substrate-specific component
MALAEERSSELEAPRESLAKKVWGLGVRHVVFMALGAALYAGLSYATNSLTLPGASNVSLRPGIVIPFFFGAVFGPWVGLFTGLVGNSISDAFSYGIYWNWEIGLGLVGFIPGLVMYFTRGRYNNARRISLAVVFSIIGLLVGLGFASLVDAFTSAGSPVTTLTTEFVPAFLSDTVFAIVLLPILLVAYNAALGRSGRS